MPSPVRNLTVSYNETHITVTWMEPDMPNGEISYNVSVFGMDLATNEVVFDEAIGSVTVTEIVFEHDVEPYALYVIEVVSITGAGPGNTTTDGFETPEGGTLLTMLCNVN